MSKARIIESLKRWEGVVPHLYLDSLSFPTCGVGFLVSSEAALLEFKWSDLEAAREDFKRLKAQRCNNRNARAFERETKARLLDVTTPLEKRVISFGKALSGYLPMDNLPPTAWDSVVDMAYNLGVVGLIKKFPKMCKAVQALDLVTAAAQCNRPQVSEERNDWTREGFLDAAAQLARRFP